MDFHGRFDEEEMIYLLLSRWWELLLLGFLFCKDNACRHAVEVAFLLADLEDLRQEMANSEPVYSKDPSSRDLQIRFFRGFA